MSNNPNFEELCCAVRQWAMDRRIIPNSTPLAQAKKAEEEVEELLEAASFLQECPTSEFAQQALMDAIGDTIVCLINTAALANLDPVDCLAHAYLEIKDRRGTLGEDGIFRKETGAES